MFTCTLLTKIIYYYYYYYYWISRASKQRRHSSYKRTKCGSRNNRIYHNKNTLLVCGLSLIPLNSRGGGRMPCSTRGLDFSSAAYLTETASDKPHVIHITPYCCYSEIIIITDLFIFYVKTNIDNNIYQVKLSFRQKPFSPLPPVFIVISMKH